MFYEEISHRELIHIKCRLEIKILRLFGIEGDFEFYRYSLNPFYV